MDAFKLLDVPPTATREEIRAAYRKLARRWHPDRFMAGPERDWANEKMAEINSAYRACLNHIVGDQGRSGEVERLERAKRLIDGGQYASARQLLMGFTTRCAEWNYLFGSLLMATREMDKAIIYLSVASHQQPNCQKYILALDEAQRKRSSGLGRLQRLFARAR